MNRSRDWSLALTAVVLGCVGCSSYRYMREATSEIERSRQEYVVNNPRNDYNDDIQAGRVRKGMSRLQVRVTWGDPDEISTSALGNEVWSYEETDPARGTAVYNLRFEGELLTTVEFTHAGTPLTTDTDSNLKLPPKDNTGTRTDPGHKPGSSFY